MYVRACVCVCNHRTSNYTYGDGDDGGNIVQLIIRSSDLTYFTLCTCHVRGNVSLCLTAQSYIIRTDLLCFRGRYEYQLSLGRRRDRTQCGVRLRHRKCDVITDVIQVRYCVTWRTGVCLTIPEGAVRQGCNVEVFLAVLRDDRDRPRLSGQSALYNRLCCCFCCCCCCCCDVFNFIIRAVID